ncbi:MAG: ABC transporter substrate-binding protein [Immundisolibacterales bacterium]|nr:ABC transporter substrate-binding protein [Immundisolibacterales bacterium]
MRRLGKVLAAAALAVSAATAPAMAAEELRIGVEGAYPPFSWKEADGSLKGFDIDIAHALCEKLGRTCVLVEQDWDGMIPALLARKYDAIVASMSITEERKKRVDFSAKYYNTPAMFVVAEGSGLDVSPAGLAGKAVGVQRGTTHQCFMEKIYPDAELRLYATQEEVFLDLAAGRLDAQFSDSLQADEGFLKTDAGNGYGFVGGPQHDLECHGEGAGIAVRKGEDELLAALNAAISAIREDGTYKTINDGYFDFDVYGD